MVNPQNQEKLLADFRESWLDSANNDHPSEYHESEIAVDALMVAIGRNWLGTNPIFLLEPILKTLKANQSQFYNQDLEVIKDGVIEFLKKDESFKSEVEKHFKTRTSPNTDYSNHPILRHFLNEPPELTPITTPDRGFKKWYKLIFLVVIVGLGSVGLWIHFNRLEPIFSLCKGDFWGSEVKIDCGDEQLSNFSKLSNQEMEDLVNNLKTDFAKERDPSTLIALNNAKVLKDLQSRSLQREDVYPIAVAIPLLGVTGSVEAGQHILSGIAKKQDELNNSLGDKKLFIIIADDQNDEELAQKIAEKLSKNSQILGVIGPYSSSNFAYVLPIYINNQVPLISPTVTAAITDVKAEESLRGFFRDQNGKPPFFFRTPEDTDASIRISLDYLKEKGYKQLIIFADAGDLYGLSLLNRLMEQSKNKFSIVEYKNSNFISIRGNDGITLAKITQDLISKYGTQKATTAILYLQGAYKDKEDSSLQAKLITVLQANQGEFLVVGSNPVRQKDLLSTLGNNPKILQQIVVMQPWFPSENTKEFKQYRDFWKSEDIVNWRYVMAYDATQVLLYAIAHRENKSKYPTKQDIQQVLNSDLIQNKDCADKLGIIDGILTTNITFNGSDRCPNADNSDGYVLIKPVEIKPGQWEWQEEWRPKK